MYIYLFLIIVGTLTVALLANSVYRDYKRYNNAWSFSAVVGYFLMGVSLAFVGVTILLTIQYGRMADLVVVIP